MLCCRLSRLYLSFIGREVLVVRFDKFGAEEGGDKFDWIGLDW